MYAYSLLAVGMAVQASALPPKMTGSAAAPVITLDYAVYQGSTDPMSNITSFLGVRYAAPPTGFLRFKAPQTPATVSGIQSAMTLPAQCWQAGTGTNPINPLLPLLPKRVADVATSEDCLFLEYAAYTRIATDFSIEYLYLTSVIVPNIANASGLPVIVWIHGGGYVAGSASAQPQTDLTVGSGNKAITVLIQYRLGVFGFLSGAEIKANGALNAGLRLHYNGFRNIFRALCRPNETVYIGVDFCRSKFGGDPTKANGGQTNPPLFRAAMTSSTFLPSQYPGDGVIPTTIYNQVVNDTGCANATDTFTCLQELPAATLGAVNTNMVNSGFFGTFTFVPVIDGTLIVERPTVTLQKGQHNGNVLLSVTNTFEGAIFVDNDPDVANITLNVQELFPLTTPAQQIAVAAEYARYNATLPTIESQAIAIMGEGRICDPPGYHAQDLAYYFFSDGPAFNNSAFIASFSSGFLDVALSLNPNTHANPASITPSWAQWSLRGRAEMLFNATAAGMPDIRAIQTDAGVLARCALWESLASETAQ
ncbi:hypothetical protein HWV62_38755 [Athelia sp. TMB]|nr:hypothetical protein HWV62_38755 [Athelia sp. TMB]